MNFSRWICYIVSEGCRRACGIPDMHRGVALWWLLRTAVDLSFCLGWYFCPLPSLLLNVESSKHPLGSTSKRKVGYGDTKHHSNVIDDHVSPHKISSDLIKGVQVRSCLLQKKALVWEFYKIWYSNFHFLILHTIVLFKDDTHIPAFKILKSQSDN